MSPGHLFDGQSEVSPLDRGRLLAEGDPCGQLPVGEHPREELWMGQLPDIIGMIVDHCEPFDTEPQVHHRHPNPVLCER